MEDKTLQEQIEKLTRQIQMQNSFKRNFNLAIIKGFGGAIGATVVFGIVIAILIPILKTINYVPIINSILNSQTLREVFRNIPQY
jgi:hypothetical protein